MKTKRQHKENKDVITDNELSPSRKGERVMNSSKTLKAAVIAIVMLLTIGFIAQNSDAFSYPDRYLVQNDTSYPVTVSTVYSPWLEYSNRALYSSKNIILPPGGSTNLAKITNDQLGIMLERVVVVIKVDDGREIKLVKKLGSFWTELLSKNTDFIVKQHDVKYYEGTPFVRYFKFCIVPDKGCITSDIVVDLLKK